MEHSATMTEARRTFPARLSILPETAAFVEDCCARHGVAHDDALRLVLIVEELVTNTIIHGHRAECDAPITLAVRVGPRGVGLRYEDTAPPFDLTAAISEMVNELDAEVDLPAPPGNIGLRLLAHLASEIRYARDGTRNLVELTLPRADRTGR
jgi:anti-sigma regulatory factor (Ser/Thr protein kinase)